MKRNVIFAVFLAFVSLSSEGHSMMWIAGNKRLCQSVCIQAKSVAVTSGVHKPTGRPFYVCRAEIENEGKRPGYNLDPYWADRCVSGHGGKERFLRSYDCLCI